MIEYPRQIAVAIRAEKKDNKTSYKTLSIEQYLSPPQITKENDNQEELPGDDPLGMHSDFSRFKITLLHICGANKVYPYANIKAEKIATFLENASAAITLFMYNKSREKAAKGPTKDEDNSVANSQKILVGEFKGKTPIQVLLESEQNVGKLKETANWLKNRLNQHNGNKRQYDAIMETIQRFENGSLTNSSIQEVNIAPIYPIYNSNINPLIHKKDEDGNVFVYGINIYCDTSYDTNPFVFEIENMYAPLNNSRKPELSKAVNKVNERIRLTHDEFCNIKRRMERTIDMFEDMYAREAFRICNVEEKKNKQK